MKLTAFDVPPPGVGVTTVTLAVPTLAMSVAGIAAVNCVALTKVVVRGLPFHCTVEPLTKLLPLTVKVKAAPPAVAPFGFKLVIEGRGLLMANVAASEVPPPGAGVVTVTLAVLAVAMSVAGIKAVNCVALMKNVVRALPFHCTVESLMNPLPVTTNVKAVPPAVAEAGFKLVMAGAGLLMVKVSPFDVPPPGDGLATVTVAVPAAAKSPAGMVAVNCVALTKLVVRLLPFQKTCEVGTKFDPLTVSVKPLVPAVAEFGFKLVKAGTGFGCCTVTLPAVKVAFKVLAVTSEISRAMG